VQGFAQRVFFAEDISRAKAQSAAAFSEVFFASLRLCARNILATDAPLGLFVQSRGANKHLKRTMAD